MREIDRIADELGRALNGDPWHGASMHDILRDVDVVAATARPIGNAHTIEEIVLHLTAWAREVTRRLGGAAPALPADGDWPARRALDPATWDALRADLRAAHQDLLSAVRELPEDRLDERVGVAQRDAVLGTGNSYAVTLHGVAQHDAYHMGQVALLHKLVALSGATAGESDAEPPWEHPDWYDLHDTTWTAGPEREPEHYRELVIALPPLDRQHHLIDVGAGTGKLAGLVAAAYPRLGRVTLVEPNAIKLERARERLQHAAPAARVDSLAASLGTGAALPSAVADVVTVGSVFMPALEFRGGTLRDGLAWLHAALTDVHAMLRPGAWMYAVETLAPPWARGGPDDPVRRLRFPELSAAIARAGFGSIECTYRFRDRAGVRARRVS